MPAQGLYEFVEYSTRYEKDKEAKRDDFPGGQTNYIPYDIGISPEQDLEQFCGDDYARLPTHETYGDVEHQGSQPFGTADGDTGNSAASSSGGQGSADDPQRT